MLIPSLIVRAKEETGDISGGTGATDVAGGTGTDASSATTIILENPIQPDTIQEFIKYVLNIVLTIGVPVIALFIIYSGFLFVKAQGDPGKLKTAKATFLYTVIGAAILLGAWVLAQAIGGTIEQIKTGV